MLYNLIEKLRIDVVGAAVLKFLNIKDMVRLERECGSKASHQLFMDLIPHCTPVALPLCKHRDKLCIKWFCTRKCKIKSLKIYLSRDHPALHVNNLQVENIILDLKYYVTMECWSYLFKSHLT